ncbi:MAG: endonuclease domain-containing protein [Hydromonas sp.]|nr:endonuclease domain-containing protein [Hydromonas sp.]
MRHTPTEAEAKIWYHLRAKRMCGVKFKRQAPMGAYIVDFVAKHEHLIIEIDGGQHNEQIDKTRTTWLENQGFKVLRFWNNEVLTNIEDVLEAIRLNLVPTQPPSPPTPLPLAGEGSE